MRPTLQLLALVASATRVFASCAHGTFLRPRAENGTVEVANFGYIGKIGPLNWAGLESPANELCATGTRQSPIDMVDGVYTLIQGSDIRLTINDMPEGADFENLGSTVEVFTHGGELKVAHKKFGLKQFHFHLPSEHLDDGTSHAMEMHLVFESAAHELAVIGVYITVNDAPTNTTSTSTTTPLLETLFSTPVIKQISAPGTKTKTPPLFMLEVVNQLKRGAFQAYSGSLTTPPCAEGVRWHVSTARLVVSPASLARARDVLGFNARFPQNSPGRPNILLVSALGSVAAVVGVQLPLPVGAGDL
ncbi:carbonic anhydrase [Parathielavia hyrcaniae]|uniref:carbonic anhydrase n=1 Tax=Parathielavia hyrcaniae TaxID=113614 RepID=A0AAN6PVT9_9PEZI|nr:carbonic anhydrase [Parathielavia hyrcaniae]